MDDKPRVMWSARSRGPGPARRIARLEAGLCDRAEVWGQAPGGVLPAPKGSGDALPDRPAARLLDPGDGGPRTWLAGAVNAAVSAWRILRRRPDLVVVDGDTSPILPALLLGRRVVTLGPPEGLGHLADAHLPSAPLESAGPDDGTAAVHQALDDALAAPGPRPGRPTAAVLGVLAFALVAMVFTDVSMHRGGMVKLEYANVMQLEYHALIRDGLVVVGSPVGYYADALHHWLFHPLLLWSADLADLAIVLNVVHYLGVAAFGGVVGRRCGGVAGVLAAALLTAAPVSPILSKHVISTAFVPLIAAGFLGAVMDLASGRGRTALGWAWVGWAALFTLNRGHLVLLIPLLYASWQARAWRPPWWGVLGALAVASSAVLKRGWHLMQHGVFTDARAFTEEGVYTSLHHWLDRMILVEPGMDHIFPNLDLLFVIAAGALATAWRRRDALPRGLFPWIWTALPLTWMHPEASVIWQTGFLALVAWSAGVSVWMRRLVMVHITLAAAGLALLMGWIGIPEGDFLHLSSLGVRKHMLTVLTDEVGMTDAEYTTLLVDHPVGEVGTPALLPGLSYLVDRVADPLPPHPEGAPVRCLSVTGPMVPPPDGVDATVAVQEEHLVFRAWDGPDCPGDPVVRVPPVLVWDTSTSTLREHTPTGPPADLEAATP